MRLTRRQWVLGGTAAGATTGLASAINFATEFRTNWLAWAAVVGLTMVVFFATAGATATDRPIGDSVRRIEVRTTRRRWMTQEARSASVEGVVLEVVEERPDGRVITSRAFHPDIAERLLELRSFEMTREVEEDR
jgi:hypothetical protein